jgi:asparagine synthase (glutamine-hydrolysing)
VDFFDNEKYFVKSSFQPDPDNRYISLMSDFIKSDHISIVLDNLKTAEAIEDAADARDLPGMADIDSSLLLFCKEIKERDTVCLSGECADEIFGGYPWYHDTDILFCDSFPWSTSTEFRKKLFNRPFIGSDCDDFVKAEYQKTLAFSDYLDADDALNRRMREMFALNFYSFMQTLLDRKDRMSMYNGLEVRVPFCDYRLVEYAFNMPWEYKSLNGREKGVVREAFKGILPDEIVHRKKSPYPKTFSPVFLDYVKNMAWRLCHDTKSVLYELVNKDFLRQLYDDKIRIQSPWYGQLMRGPQVFAYLVQIDCFFKKFNLKIVD